MSRHASRPAHARGEPFPQPLATAGEQGREGDVEREELNAARAWLRHVEAGTVGKSANERRSVER